MKQVLFCMAAALSFYAAAANGPIGKHNPANKAKQPATQQKTKAAAPDECVGENKKLINGVCETGTRVWTRSEFDNVNHWYRCYYYWRWSDGSTSPEYYTINGAGCIV